MIVPSSHEDARGRAREPARDSALDEVELDPAGRIAVSIGIAQGPEHAANPRELVACAEAAMMTAKARGKNQVVFFDDAATERPAAARQPRRGHPLDRPPEDAPVARRQAQPLERRARDRRGDRQRAPPADRLPQLPRVHPRRRRARADRLPGRADRAGPRPRPRSSASESARASPAASSRPASRSCSADASKCEFAITIEGTTQIEESIIAVPLNYGARVIGVIVVSKLGLDQFDEDDLRLLEVLAGHAAVALENARLYEAQRREAESAKALLEFGRELAAAEGLDHVLDARRRGCGAADRRAARVALAAGAGDGDLVGAGSVAVRGRARDRRQTLRRRSDRAVRRADRAVRGHARSSTPRSAIRRPAAPART